MLEDSDIAKVGVSPSGDAKFLARDYGVCVASTFDLRFMAATCGCRPGGLGKMSKDYLDVKLDKNWRVTCSDWEAPKLSPQQVDYAAKDAHVAIELFRRFAAKIEPKSYSMNTVTYVKRIIDKYCFPYFDQAFNGSRNITSRTTSSSATNA